MQGCFNELFRVGFGGLWEGMLATIDAFPLFKYCSAVFVPGFFERGLIHLKDENQFPKDILKHFLLPLIVSSLSSHHCRVAMGLTFSRSIHTFG